MKCCDLLSLHMHIKVVPNANTPFSTFVMSTILLYNKLKLFCELRVDFLFFFVYIVIHHVCMCGYVQDQLQDLAILTKYCRTRFVASSVFFSFLVKT